jgi:hypoxanthine-DNA glycosylase
MIYSFPPISDPTAEVLILGTMPGEKSLKLNQYYGHGGNQFWKLIFAIHNTPFSSDYSLKKEILIKNRIALWDVLKVCERAGSADSAIAKEESNDFLSFFQNHPNIKLIAFNGSNAETYFNTYSGIKTKIEKITLPSTSPANTWKTFDEKLEQWKKIKAL